MRIPDDISSQLPNIAKTVALPAILAGAGTGALSAYMSSRARPQNEHPSQRRRRILRNALVGTLLGGTAGATLPLGMKTLSEPFIGEPQGVAPLQRILGFGLSNAAPLAAGIGGGAYLGKLRGQERGRAMSDVTSRLSGTAVGGTKVTSPAHVTALLEGGNRDAVLKALAAQGGQSGDSISRILKSHELLGEAGYKGKVLDRLGAGSDIWGKLKTTEGGPQAAIRRYILSHSVLPGKAKGFGISGLMSKLVGNQVSGRSTTPIAEAYLNTIRPAAKRMIGRGGWMGRMGLLGGGVLAAKELQDALTGAE